MTKREVVRRKGIEMGGPGRRSIRFVSEKIQRALVLVDFVEFHCLKVRNTV